ncbi:M56 family metallopeptidase [Winogradskyella sp. MIT101101]|uniref:M56 family metallopeptidase n=1 Tax=Winogradskyella sp. MIT101101 TaxID=3098297 RepID=UPI00399A35A9
MEYLLKASAVVFIFYLFYKLMLQRETFFQTNRLYLITGLVTAIALPLVIIPIYIEYTPVLVEASATFDIGTEGQGISKNATKFDWLQFSFMIYGIGVAFFFSKLLIELASLKLLFNRHSYFKNGSYILIETDNDIPPFSFFNWIVYNPNKYSNEELEHILNHEKAHAKELHSIDIMITQLACVVFWFNPFIWLYKKEIEQNLEFIADDKAQNFSECEKSYQLVLLKSSVPKNKLLITNTFYNSQIKKRIIMLHKSKSNRLNAWKYALILPALALFLMSFNTKEILIEVEDPANLSNTAQNEASSQLNDFYNNINFDNSNKAIASNKANVPKKNQNRLTAPTTTKAVKNKSKTLGDVSITIIDKNTTDSELDKIKETLKKEGLTIKFKGVKRNNNGEITAIKIDAKSKKSSTNYQISSDDEAIEPIKIVFDEENNSISIGNGHAKHGHNTYVYETKAGWKHKIHKTGSGNNVFVISDDEHEEHVHEDHEHDEDHEHEAKVIVKKRGKKGKLKKIKQSKDVRVISGDEDGEIIEIIVDEDGDDKKETIIVNGEKISTANGKKKNVWVTKTDGTEDTFVIELDDSDDNVFISGDNGKSPLFIVDGKEVSREKFKDLNAKEIESVTVLKDKNAIEKYGDKGKDGVIIVKTKKN